MEHPESHEDKAVKCAALALAAYALARGLSEDALDDDVYDLAGEEALADLNVEESEAGQEDVLGKMERRAGAINGGGFREQIQFLLGGYADLKEGVDGLRR